eukprot:356434_1
MAMININEDTPTRVLKSVFKSYDADGNGELDKNEFNTLLSDLGIKEEEAQAACKLLADSNNDGVVSKDEFYDWIKKEKIQQIMNDSDKMVLLCGVTAIFKGFDVDGDNTISWKEFKVYMVDKEKHTIQTAQAFWSEIDADGDGVITFKEFWGHTKGWNGEYYDEE